MVWVGNTNGGLRVRCSDGRPGLNLGVISEVSELGDRERAFALANDTPSARRRIDKFGTDRARSS